MHERTHHAQGMMGKRRIVAAMAVMILSSACTVRLIAEYDPILDSSVSALSSKVNSFLARMETTAGTPAGEYAPNAGFYAEVLGELKTLQLRTEQQEKAKLIEESLVLLSRNIENLRSLHQAGGAAGLSVPVLGPARSALETQFRALFAIENALRRGK